MSRRRRTVIRRPRAWSLMDADRLWMRHAIALARRGLTTTPPNPAVGAVLVRNGRLLGHGYHVRPGEPHAEPNAIADAHRRGETPRGAVLYVTLEPCSSHGRTPPCVDAILAHGVRRVVVGATDPDPRHEGRAYATLRSEGVVVRTGVLEVACRALNPKFHRRWGAGH